MPTVTRHGVFETNSSSTHSLGIRMCVPHKLNDQQIQWSHIPVEAGVCRVWPGEFGWEVETYYDAPTKASYALTYLRSFGDREVGKWEYPPPDHKPIWVAKPDGTKAHWENMLIRAVLCRTGAKEVRFVPLGTRGYGLDPNAPNWGYIDHQSSDVCEEAFASQEALEAFIFNPESFLHTDNDNH